MTIEDDLFIFSAFIKISRFKMYEDSMKANIGTYSYLHSSYFLLYLVFCDDNLKCVYSIKFYCESGSITRDYDLN